MKKTKRKNSDDFASLSPKDRIQKCLDILPDILGDWESSHREWRVEVLLWILDASLKSLRHYIEFPEEPEISWESPFVELHFPVQCSWKEDGSGKTSFELVSGQISENDVEDIHSMELNLSKILVEHIQIVALQELTNSTGFEKRDGELQAFLDPSTVELVRETFPPEKQEQEIQRLFWPISFGAGHIDYGDDDCENFEDGREIGEETIAQIEAIRKPLLYAPFDADGRKMRVITVLEINPLIADFDKKEAYFPIIVGLAVQLDDDVSESESTLSLVQSAGLTEWPEELLIELWDALDDLLQAALAECDPQPDPEMVEAVVSVNAQIKFMVPNNDKESLTKAIANLTKGLGREGELLSFSMRHQGKLLLNPFDASRFEQLLEDVVHATGSDDKGKSLEALLEALFASIPSFTVVNRVRTESEEIDLWISNNSDQRPFRDESDVILAECKNWSGKCGKNEFVQLYHKIANRGKRCTIGFLISWNGFAETITTEMLRASREAPLIVPIDGNGIRQAIDSGDFLQLLTIARQNALMI